MSMDNRAIEQRIQLNVMPVSLKNVVFLARDLARTIFDTLPAKDAAKNAGEMVTKQVIMEQTNSDITARFRGVTKLPILDMIENTSDPVKILELRDQPTQGEEEKRQAPSITTPLL